MTTETTLQLQITPRAAAVTIAADPALDRPYRVSWEGAAPNVSEHEGEIEVGYSRLRTLAPRRASLSLALNPAGTWAIDLRGGVSDLRADLRDLRVSGITVSGGAKDVVVDLPRPDRELAVRVEGGVSNAVVRRPAGVPVAVEIYGGATGLRLDDSELGAVGGVVRQRADGGADGESEVAVRILGGASGLTVEGYDG
jgi:hypothetical protein